MIAPDTLEHVASLTPEDVARLPDDRRARSSLEIGAIIHVVQPLSVDLLATLCFYAVSAATRSVGIAAVLAAGARRRFTEATALIDRSLGTAKKTPTPTRPLLLIDRAFADLKSRRSRGL